MAKVVVWTQAYNAEKTLRRAMDSILQQTYTDFEYYVLNNASTDGTGAIIEEYAKKDPRVIPLSVERNSIKASKPFLLNIAKTKNMQWLVWCDADDSYSPDFLKKSIDFAETEHLDLVASGYDYVDGSTNQTLKIKSLKENLILEKNTFIDHFVEFRAYTTTVWAKLINFPSYISIITRDADDSYKAYTESSGVLALFKQADRVGILKDVMYHYYQYPSSLIRTLDPAFFFGYNQHWDILKQYVASYGPISNRNMDFLYAIYLSFIEERLNTIYAAPISFDQKIKYITDILDNNRAKETFSRNASPEFRNLAARKNFLDEIYNQVANLQKQANISYDLSDLFRIIDCLQEL